jgi:nicotinamidase/pyrazinamidase
MVSRDVVFWDVDTQADFMLPGGKLYVPGAEKLIPNVKRLVDVAREGRVFLLGDADAHTMRDKEFQRWPPHCLKGTLGQKFLPETLTEKVLTIPKNKHYKVPADLGEYQQVILEKNTLDVFDNPHTEKLLEHFDRNAIFVIFGVVTEYCVRLAAKGLLERGRRVALVTDAVETLNPADGKRTMEELAAMGAQLISTEQALALVDRPASAKQAAT